MNHFIRNIALITIGVIINVAAFQFFPSTVNMVTAALSTKIIEPLDDPWAMTYKNPSSNKKQTAAVPFALPKVNLHNNNDPIQTDINGDGLTDIVLSTANTGNALQYVLLNNGTGYEIAYMCYFIRDNSTGIDTYKGDCADYS
jgi:hypothetical protein